MLRYIVCTDTCEESEEALAASAAQMLLSTAQPASTASTVLVSNPMVTTTSLSPQSPMTGEESTKTPLNWF